MPDGSLRLASEKDVLLDNLTTLAKKRLEQKNQENETEIKTRRSLTRLLSRWSLQKAA